MTDDPPSDGHLAPDATLWGDGSRAALSALQAMLDTALDAVVAMDGEARTVIWNPSAEAMFGFTRDEMIGRDLLATIAPPDLEKKLREQLERYHREGEAWPLNELVELRARRADGSEFPGELSVTDAHLADGSPIFTAYIRDISERKRTESLLARRVEQQAAVAELGRRALAGGELGELMEEVVGALVRTLDIDAATLLELETGKEELVVRAAAGLPPGLVGETRVPAGEGWMAGHALTSKQPVVVEDWSTEVRFEISPQLRQLNPASMAACVVPGEDGAPWGLIGVQSHEQRRFTPDDLHFIVAMANVLGNAIERRRTENAIRHRALHDPLTGLPNRGLFLDRLEHALAQSDRREGTVAVLFLDLDQLKVVNDSLGHGYGDRLLTAVVPRLSDALRPGDTLARFGGDEFVILCEGIDDEHDAITVAERLLGCFGDPFTLGERDQFVSASMGIALPRGDGQGAEELIRDADAAMYRAKERGRARYELFDEGMRARTTARLRTEHDLRRARPGEHLNVHYQPIVSLGEGDLAGFEALIRWNHPSRGDIPPAEFIPIAEESGLIGKIGRWVLEQAAEQGVRWRGRAGARDLPLAVAVNLSARQFASGGLADEVAEVLAATGLEPERLLLEITETVLMEETEATIEALHGLKALGVKLVLDDFGTGYSSLSYVERFPIDAIKIDRSFVAGLDSGGSAAIVTAIVSMAHSLDMRVTAEGVETAEQLEHLRRIGCEYAQGYFFGRPAAPAAHDRLLVARVPMPAERH